MMEGLARDLKQAARSMTRHRLFSATIVVTLALTIGGTATVFGVLNTVLLEPLPYDSAEELVYMNEAFRETQTKSVSYLNYLDWRDQNHSFRDVAARTFWGFTLTGQGDARELSAMLLSENVLDLLGVRTQLGRGFSLEDVEEESRVALLSDELWRGPFGAGATVVGRTIALSGEPYTVLGVMPPGLEFPLRGVDVWAPITTLGQRDQENRGSHPGIVVLARLDEGVSFEAAIADMDAVASRLSSEYPETNAESGVNVYRLRDRYVRNARPTIYLLMGAVSLVLLIACGNVAGLFLVRATTRARESAVRIALGSGRGRLVRQMLSESLMLSVVGGGLGLLLATGALGMIRRLQPGGLPRLDSVALDGTVVMFTSAVVVLAGVAFGLVPALQVAGTNPGRSLRAAGGRGAGSTGASRARAAFVTAQVALALVLLNGAGLMVRSVVNLFAESPGLETSDRLTAQVRLPQSEYPTAEDRALFFGRLLDGLAALPGVDRVAGIDPLPLSGANRQWSISREGFSSLDENGLRVDQASVTPGYFRTMGIPVLAGSEFTGDERPEAPTAIVDERLAERLWPGRDAVGRRFKFRGSDSPWMTVAGVVAHVKNQGVGEDSREQVYLPYTVTVFSLSVVLHASVDAASLVPAVRRELAELDPDVPIARVTTMEDLLGATIGQERLAARTLVLFAGMALILAVLGLYGVVSYSVGLRTREIGIRMALGADGKGVLGDVLKQGIVLALVGVMLGVAAALGLARVFSSLLFGVGGGDARTLAAVSGVMLAVALIASGLPALRATRVDPTVALRAE